MSSRCLWSLARGSSNVHFCPASVTGVACGTASSFSRVTEWQEAGGRAWSPCPVLVLPSTRCVTVDWRGNLSGPPVSSSVKRGGSRPRFPGLGRSLGGTACDQSARHAPRRARAIVIVALSLGLLLGTPSPFLALPIAWNGAEERPGLRVVRFASRRRWVGSD